FPLSVWEVCCSPLERSSADLIITRSSCADPREVVVDNLLSEDGILELKQKISRRQKNRFSASAHFLQSVLLFSLLT
uniref:hypothetical protein n=2 Tax=Faecalibaculum rodentium TaxID=1702221 RepID=UPI00261F7F67